MNIVSLFLHVTGSDNVSGRWYGFWSGFGGDLPIFGGLYVWLRHHNCHQLHCWRIGRHPYQDGQVYCKHHRPLATDKKEQ